MAGYTIPQLVIILIVIAAVIAIAMIAIRRMGINIPDWVIQIGWVIIVAVVAILGIKLLLSLV